MRKKYTVTEAGAKIHATKRIKQTFGVVGVIVAGMSFLHWYTSPTEEQGIVLGITIITCLLFGSILFFLRKALILLLQHVVVTTDDLQLTYEITPLTSKPNVIVQIMYQQLLAQSPGNKSLKWTDLEAYKESKLYLLVKGQDATEFTGKDIIYLPYELENLEELRAQINVQLKEKRIYDDLQL